MSARLAAAFTTCQLALDVIPSPLGIYAENNAAIVPIFAQWIAPLKDPGVTTVSMRPSGSTDDESFDQVGIPGFQFIQDPRDYETRSVHTNQDVYERLSAGDLKQAAVVEATFLYNAAMRDQMLPRKPLPHPELAPQIGGRRPTN
jgi:carboxypeptidase Q